MDLSFIRIQNFMSIEDATVDYRGSGLTLVKGQNGVGKSGLFVEPLLWLFYDQLNRSDSKQNPNKVKRRYRKQPVEADTTVEAWFENRGQSFYVKRSLNDGWEISANNANITPYRTKTDALPIIESGVVGLPPNLFRSIAVMGQGFKQRFTDFKDSDRTSIVEDFIGAAIFEETHDFTKDRSKTLVDRVSGYATATATAKATMDKTQEALEFARQQQAGWKVQQESEEKRLIQESEQLGTSRSQYEQNAAGLQTHQESIGGEVSRLEDIRAVTQSNIDSLNQTIGAVGGSLGTLSTAKATMESLRDICPTCKSQVNPQIVHQELQDLQVKMDLANQQRSQAQQSLQTAQSQLAQTDEQLRQKRLQKSQIDSQLQQVQNEIQRIDTRFQTIQSELSGLGNTEILYAQNVRNLEQRFEQEIRAYETAVAVESEFRELMPYLSWWTEHYSVRGLRSWRLGGALEKMNYHLAASCMKLFDGQIMVRLLPVKPQASGKSKSVVTVDVDSTAGSYEMSSGGQARCIDLAIHFAFRRLAVQSANGWGSNFLIGDEIFDHLDRQVAERALGVLRKEAQRVFLITHSPALQAYCDSTWEVEMEDERTRLVLPGGMAA